jgi:hypothetical protein
LSFRPREICFAVTGSISHDLSDIRDSLIGEKARAAHGHQSAAAVQVAPQVDVADQLTKLAALRDPGVLTDKKFLSQKKRILGS